jgi:hypothetical protein
MIMINMITAFLPIRFGTNEGQPVLSVFVVLDISMVLTKTCHVQRFEGKTLHSTYVPVKKHVLLSVKIWVHCKLLFRVFSLDPPRTEPSQKLGPGGGVQFDRLSCTV